ncbi:MAG: SIMPL domain-containing protein, partial [Pseudomonadota bacterium]
AANASNGGMIIGGFLVAAGLALAGFFVGDGFLEGRKETRYVTVKGLAERQVRADVANWPLRFTAAGNELSEVQAKIEADTAAISEFLTDGGVPAADVRPQRLEVVDQLAQQYRSGPIQGNRFIITQTVLVRSSKVDTVEALSRQTGELVKRGVILSDMAGPRYSFTALNDIKPAMIAEATRNARDSAEQFAADSGSDVGAILRANQGYFQILALVNDMYGQGEAGQADKVVRVVTTIDYLLED